LGRLLHHEHASLTLAQRCSAVTAGAPLFTTLLNYRYSRAPAAGWEGERALIQIKALHAEERTNYPLVASVDDLGDGLRLSIQAKAPIEPQRVCALLQRALAELVQALEHAPRTQLRAIDILPEEEKWQQLIEWNATGVEYPSEKCIHELFEEQVRRTPDAVAAVYEDQLLTYGELNARANRLAHYLREQEVGPDRLVGLCVERGMEMAVGMLAILKAGGAYVPLDPGYPTERLAYALGDAAPSVVLTQQRLKRLLPSCGAKVIALDGDWSEINRRASGNPCAEQIRLRPEHCAYVIYTSGSTGKPKGVMVAHRNAARLFAATDREFGFNERDVWTLFHSYAFDFSVWELWGALLFGGRLVIVSHLMARSPEEFYRLLCREGVTVLNQTPSAFAQLIQAQAQALDLKHVLRVVIFGGESLEFRTLKSWVQRNSARHPRLVNMYGITETTVHVTYRQLSGEEIESERSSIIGRPIPDLKSYLLDGHGQLVRVGVVGVFYIGGAGVARGYLNRAGLTAARFVPNPFGSELGARMYRSGDLARWMADGDLEFLGRADHQVKIRGYRIELGEIEAQLLSHPQVREAVVLAREDEKEGKCLVAYYKGEDAEDVTGDSKKLGAQELREYLTECLPPYMVPAAYVRLEAFPLTPNGKVDRRALPAPEAQAYGRGEYKAPQGMREEVLASLWSGLLTAERVGREDDFFELGGHSLLAMQLVSQVREAFSVELAVREVFEHPRLREQARAIERAQEQPSGRESMGSIEVVSRTGPLRLSYAQERLWFLGELMGASAVYTMPLALRLKGEVDEEALVGSLRALVERHETLRTRFEKRDGVAVQVIEPPFPVEVACVEGEGELERVCRAERGHCFEVSKERLSRIRVLRVGSVEGTFEYVVLLTLHHSVSDGWSLGVLFRELTQLYGALSRGEPSPLQPLAIQYADYAQWQREWLQGEVLQGQLSYWREQLAGLPPVLQLPTDRPRPVEQTYRGSVERFSVSKDITEGLQRLSRESGATLFMTLLSAFGVLMSRYSGQQEVAIGTPIAGRARVETHGLIGFFVNTLVMRCDVSGEPSFVELLRRMREVALQGYAHQDIPFEQLVEELNPQRSLSHSPLFQVMFVLQNTPKEGMELQGVRIEPVSYEEKEEVGVSRFDLTFNVSEASSGLVGSMVYNTDLFDRGTVRRLLEHYERLLGQIVATPNAQVASYELLSEAQKRQQLVDWNATAMAYPRDKCIHQLFEEQVRRTPDAVAVVYEDQVLTYGDLNARANRLAGHLIDRGIEPDSRVAICMARSPEMMVALLGVLKAGGAYVPLDPDSPPERLRYLLEDAAPLVLLTHRCIFGLLPESSIPMIRLDEDWKEIGRWPPSNPARRESTAVGNRLAYVIYTSGSTGRPKGVMVEHQNIVNYSLHAERQFDVLSGEGTLICTPLSVDLTLTGLFPTLTSGRTIRLIPDSTKLEILWTELQQNRNLAPLKLTPSHLQMLECMHQHERLKDCVRVLVLGGEPLPGRVARWWQEHSPSTRIFNHYGPTETTVGCVVHEIGDVTEDPIPIGRPIANARLYVLDEVLQQVPVGVAGEIYIGGAGVARGYLSRPGLTAQRFVADPFSAEAGARMYRSGDLGRWRAAGNIEYLGRNDDQVKVRGYRVEVGEIEAALLSHDGISQAAVLAREDQEGEKRLVAYYTTASEAGSEVEGGKAKVGAKELHEQLAHRLPQHMLPAAYVRIEEFPLTPSGKVDRHALPAPEEQAYRRGEYEAPQGMTEEVLSSLWSGLLRVGRVGQEDGFFELGGHSLLAMQLLSRVREAFSVELSVRDVFEHRTLREQAAAIERVQGEQSGRQRLGAIGAVPRSEALRLSYAQERLWFLGELIGPSAVYTMPLALRLKGEVDEEALLESLRALVQRHETLRTRYERRDGVAVQVIELVFPIEVECIEEEAEVEGICRAEGGYCFEITGERLSRIRVLRVGGVVGPVEYVVLVTLHHSVSDGWSRAVFIREWVAVYDAYAQGRSSPLKPLAVQYADYAHWQRQLLQGEALEGQLRYWREQLAGLPPVLQLPMDRGRPVQQTYRGSQERFSVSKELTEALQALSRESGATLFMTLLSAFGALLSRYSGQESVAIGTPVANRIRMETEGLIGFFVNTLVMRCDVSGEPNFVQLLRRMREVALQGYAHQDVPFEQLVDTLNPRRSLSHSPLFQVMFALQNQPMETVELQRVQIEPVRYELKEGEGVSRFDLTLSLSETGSGLVGALEYNTDLFNRGTVRRLLEHYERLLVGIAADPEVRVMSFELLSQEEKRQQLVDWNVRESDCPHEECIHELFEGQVRRTPDTIVVVCEDQALTYSELNARANRLAHHLRAQGVEPESRVGLYVERDVEMAVGLLAILKAGGAYVMLSPAYAGERLGYLIEENALELILAQSSFRLQQELRSYVGDSGLPRWVPVGLQDAQRYSSADPEVGVSASSLACVMYQADQLGVPVGVMVSHGGVLDETIGRGDGLAGEFIASLLAWSQGPLSGEAADVRGSVESYDEVTDRRTHYVLDRYRELLPIGATGELYVGGRGVSRGYLNRGGLTAECFVPDPFGVERGARMHRTGNTTRWTADGRLQSLRAEDQLTGERGKQEELADIQRVLVGHEGVVEAAVGGLDEPARRGLVAYVVDRSAGAEPAERLIAQLKGYLRTQPTFCPIPQEWMILKSLPRTPSGNIDRSGLPPPEGASDGHGYVAPLTELERTLVDIWQEQLGIVRVGIEDNYFVLGGDSIRSVSLVAEAQKRGVRFSVKDLFSHPTVSGVASAIEHGEASGGSEAEDDIAPLGLLTDREREQLCLRHDMATVEDAYPLSMMQQGMLLESLRHSALAVYQNFHFYRFGDTWNASLFEHALHHLIAKHPMLRTIVDLSGERPLQLVVRELAPRLEVLDLRGANGEEVQAALREWMERQRSEPLVPSSSLWRLSIHLLRDQSFIFGMFIHHALWDGWSLESFATELYATYGMLKSGGHVEEHQQLPSYKRFIALEQLAVSSKVHREYWLRKLEGASVPWWTGREKSASENIGCEISAATSRRFSGVARSLGVQEKSVWCSVYLALLSLLAGVDDVVGTVITQGRPELAGGEKILGVFLNALPIRVPMSGMRWADLITATDRELREQHAYRRYPLAELQRLTGLDCAGAMFSYTNWHVYYDGVGEQGTVDRWIPQKVAGWQETNYLFGVLVRKDEKAERHYVGITADETLFDADLRRRMRSYVTRIVCAIEENVYGNIHRAGLLGDEELHRQLIEWNATEREYPRDRCIHELFEEQVRRTPDAMAAVFENHALTYERLNERANSLAQHLRSDGVRVGEHLVLRLRRSVELIACELAASKCGAVYVPIDPDWPEERQRFVTKDCRAQRILIDGFKPAWQQQGVRWIDVGRVTMGHRDGGGRRRNLAVSISGEASAYVMYTSGSSGVPKGVVVPHRAISRLVLNNAYMQSGASDRIAVAANPAFDASTLEIWAPLLNGGCAVVVDGPTVRDPQLFAALLRNEGVSVLWLTVGLFNQYAQQLCGSFSKLRYLIVGGDVLDARVIRKTLEAGAPEHFLNGYGPTETTTFASTYEINEIRNGANSVPIGRPISNAHIYLLSETMEPVPEGVQGEIYIGGAGVAVGYLRQPGLTVERFTPNPFSAEPGERLYRTGDLARWMPDGNLEFLGRGDNQVKIRGYRIELGEVEEHLLSHPQVQGAVVLALAREPPGGEKHLVAYYTSRDTQEPRAEEVRAYLKERLPEHMVPAAYMRLERFPLTPNGKVDRRALPAPENEAYGRREYEAPQGEIERAVGRIWEELLGIERIGRQDNFFQLGGHSLMAIRLQNRLEALGHTLPVDRIFKCPQLLQLAQCLSNSERIERHDNVIVFRAEGCGPPLFLIHEVSGDVTCLHRLAREIDRGFPIYGMELRGGLPSSMSNLAGNHLKRMRIIQSHGPYRLAGYSFGGLVAYEIAHQLLGMGEEVSFLGLIDTFAPEAIQRLGALKRVPFANHAAGTFENDLSDVPQLSMAHACAAIAKGYHVRPMNAPALLFEATDGAPGETSSMGWKTLPGCQLTSCLVPGSHQSMIIDPSVQVLARTMSAAIQQSSDSVSSRIQTITSRGSDAETPG
jgi:amino acid adenylation domain-containing protein